MIGRYLREPTKGFLNWIAKGISRVGITPNGVTFLSLVIAALAAYFIYIDNYGWAFLFVLLAGGFDALDGSVARNLNMESKFGNYLDAIVDRYVEMIILFGFALSGYALPAFIAMAGGLMLSYTKARTAIVKPIKNNDWPSLGDRFDKFFLILLGILLSFFIRSFDVIFIMLYVLAAINHFGAIQRIVYAKKLIEEN